MFHVHCRQHPNGLCMLRSNQNERNSRLRFVATDRLRAHHPALRVADCGSFCVCRDFRRRDAMLPPGPCRQGLLPAFQEPIERPFAERTEGLFAGLCSNPCGYTRSCAVAICIADIRDRDRSSPVRDRREFRSPCNVDIGRHIPTTASGSRIISVI